MNLKHYSVTRPVTILAAGLAFLSANAATTDQPTQAYEMRAYLGWPGSGRELVAGRYSDAINAARKHRRKNGEIGLLANTNLCVAYTVTHRFEEADKACSKALTLAHSDNAGHRFRGLESATAESVALSNRGVLHAVRGNELQATTDFRRAARMNRSWNGPAQNLAYLGQGKVARIEITAR